MTGTAWTLLRRRFAGLVILLGILCLIAILIAFVPVVALFTAHAVDSAPREDVLIGVVVLAVLLVYAVFGIAGAATARVVEGEVTGRPVGVASALAHTLSRAHVIVVVQLAFTLAWTVGTMLLVVPGILAAMYGFAAVPAAAIERIGPVEAFRRSAAICDRSKGTAIAVVALSVVGYLVAYAASQCIGTVGVLPMLFGGGGGAANMGVTTIGAIILFSFIGQVIQFVGMVWIWLLSASHYIAAHPPNGDAEATSAVFR